MNRTLLIFLLAAACKAPQIQRAEVLQPDEDLGNIFFDKYYNKEHDVFIKVDNDSEVVIIRLAVNDDLSQAKIDMYGSTLWIDTKGGGKRELGIVIMPGSEGRFEKIESSISGQEDKDTFKAVKVPGLPKESLLTNDNLYGLRVHTVFYEKYQKFIYSYSFPLSVLHIGSSSVIGIFYETNTKLLSGQRYPTTHRTKQFDIQSSSRESTLSKKKNATIVESSPGTSTLPERSNASNMRLSKRVYSDETDETVELAETEEYLSFKFKVLVQLNNEFMELW